MKTAKGSLSLSHSVMLQLYFHFVQSSKSWLTPLPEKWKRTQKDLSGNATYQDLAHGAGHRNLSRRLTSRHFCTGGPPPVRRQPSLPILFISR
jgi:hypothetical protein